MMTEKDYIRKGDIFYVEPEKERHGHIQAGTRPCIVVNNQVASCPACCSDYVK